MKQVARMLLLCTTLGVFAYALGGVKPADDDKLACDCSKDGKHACPSGFGCTGSCQANGEYDTKCMKPGEEE